MKKDVGVKILNGVDVSLILCAYNEADVIVDAVKRVERVLDCTGLDYEIVVVDDGSSDGTLKRVLDYKNADCNGDRLKVVGYGRNMGKGNAIMVGFKHSRGDLVVFMDGDLDVNPSYIPEYIEALKDNDVVIGCKWHRNSYVKMNFKRKFLSFGFNIFSRILTGIKLRDTQTGLKGFRRYVLEEISSRLVVKRYAFDLELMAMCNHCGYKIAEMPVDVSINQTAHLKEIFRMALDTIKVAYRLRVLRLHMFK